MVRNTLVALFIQANNDLTLGRFVLMNMAVFFWVQPCLAYDKTEKIQQHFLQKQNAKAFSHQIYLQIYVKNVHAWAVKVANKA